MPPVSPETVDAARAATRDCVDAWWHALSLQAGVSIPIASCSLKFPPLAPTASLRARTIGEGLAALSVPAAVEAIGKLYTGALPAAHRSLYGIFYTPPLLVGRLLDQATVAGVDWRTARVVSPSCGGGAILVKDALRMAAAMAPADPGIVISSVGRRLVGWDRDPFACWLSQVAVEAALLDLVAASGRRLARITECRDSLMDDWADHAGTFDLVNDNPPFGKVRKSDALARRFARSQRGHMNAYGLFMDLALHLAKERGGVIAYLTPTSYLSGDYFAKLRTLLASEAPPVCIDIVESRTDVFPDVLQEVALSVFVRGRRNGTAACSCVRADAGGLRVDGTGELELPEDVGTPWLVARDPEGIAVVTAMRGMHDRLSDWGYRVRTGPLVPHKNERRMHFMQVPGAVPVVWAESISAIGGRFTIRCSRIGRRAWYVPSGDGDANVTAEGAVLLQRTTAKEQARRLIGAFMSERDVASAGGRIAVENHVNMLVPAHASPTVTMAELATFLASRAADTAFRCISGSVAVSAAELGSLPLPSAPDLRKALSSTDPEAALSRFYGLTADADARTRRASVNR